MVGKRTRTIALLVFVLMVVISATMLFIRIYDGSGTMMPAIALYLSIHSLDITESVQNDSHRSADSAKDSVKIAEEALEIAKSEADANAVRYRIGKGSFLAFKKKEFLITSSNNIKVMSEPADTKHDRTGRMLLCRYETEALGDVPLQAINQNQRRCRQMESPDWLKNDLANSVDWNVTITVSKKNIEKLVAAYEALKQEQDEKKN